jgi:DNA-3-methyladenine glycosylase II
MEPSATPAWTGSLPARPPFRLELTVSALRRLPANPVDILTAEGTYRRAFLTPRGPVVWTLRQDHPAADLHLSLHGAVDDPAPWQALAARMLGTEVDLAGFYAAAQHVPDIAPLVARMRGVKPPRYPTLWEALVNALVFQQVSLHAALAILRRVIARFSPAVPVGGDTLYPFPTPEAILTGTMDELRGLGLSAAKARALLALAGQVVAGQITEGELAALPSPEAAQRLIMLPGIGPWSAAVVLLRGLGRLDVFPGGDSGMAATLRRLLGVAPGAEEATAARLVAAPTPYQGMLYYHLLLGRLAATGVLRTED